MASADDGGIEVTAAAVVERRVAAADARASRRVEEAGVGMICASFFDDKFSLGISSS